MIAAYQKRIFEIMEKFKQLDPHDKDFTAGYITGVEAERARQEAQQKQTA